MSNIKSREIRLKSRPATRPAGLPLPENFELAAKDVTGPGAGEVLVRNVWMSVDPYMRGRMTDTPSYIPPFKLGEALEGHAIGEVIASNAPDLQPGDFVNSMFGWREYFTAPASALEKTECNAVPIQTELGVLGMPGFAAWLGLLKIGELKPGETVFVSSAAGAVGSIACQIAKVMGCTVVGSAGSDEKCAWLRETAHVDHTINYKTAGDLTLALRRAVPEGVDVYFDNVGGSHLIATLGNMKVHGRLAICGMIARYNNTHAPEPSTNNIVMVLRRSLKMQGFLQGEFLHLRPQFRADMLTWIKAGKIRWHETIFEGIDKAPRAFLGLFSGDNLGKMLVRLGPDAVR